MVSSSISYFDYFIICIYLVGIFILAFYSGRRNVNSPENTDLINEQYMAGNSLTFWESLCSIIATEVSALTFLGIPAFAYAKDFSFIQIYMGALLGRIIIAKVFLPRIYNKGLTIYATMAEENGTINGRRFTSICFVISKILAVGVRLFSGSILVSEFFNISIYLAVALISLITFFYTMIGGLKAVVRTDMAQMALFVFGGILAHFIIPHIDGRSWLDLMQMAHTAGKTQFLSFTNPWPFLTGIMGGVLFDMATHGVDQDFVQRLIANKSLKSAQRAIIASTFFSISIGLIFLGIGALLWAHYQSIAAPLINPDQLFAYFITQYFPAGVKGLMVAGVLAATMSTLDSTINALSACFYNDIIHHKIHSQQNIVTYYKRDTLIITLLLLIVAFFASKSDGLLLFGLKITTWTAGSLLALFFATVIWQKWIRVKLNTMAVIGAYFFGILGVYTNFKLELAWEWNVYFGFGAAIIFLYSLGKWQHKKIIKSIQVIL